MKTTTGVLALQGGYASHIKVLNSLDQKTREVRTTADLAECDALVIPGGESTVLTRLLMQAGTGYGTSLPWRPAALYLAIREFAKTHPVMGTCAGLIMLASPCDDERVVPFDVLPVTVERNAYGRQTESFIEEIELDLSGANNRDPAGAQARYSATFIRAPKIIAVGKGVSVLARARSASGDMDPVMVQYGKILGLTFHPELTPADTRIHRYFLSFLE